MLHTPSIFARGAAGRMAISADSISVAPADSVHSSPSFFSLASSLTLTQLCLHLVVTFSFGIIFSLFETRTRLVLSHRYLRYKERFEDVLSTIVTCMCFYSIACDYSGGGEEQDDQHPPLQQHEILLRMTPLQTSILLLVSSTFLFELGLMYSRPRARLDTKFMWHHLIGIAGIYYELYYRIGGGTMTRLLLDVLTDFAQYLRTYLNDQSMGRGEWPFLLIFFAVRCVWYMYILACTLQATFIVSYSSIPSSSPSFLHHATSHLFVWQIQLLIWFIFSSIYHFTWLRQEWQTMKWRTGYG